MDRGKCIDEVRRGIGRYRDYVGLRWRATTKRACAANRRFARHETRLRGTRKPLRSTIHMVDATRRSPAERKLEK